MKRFGLISMALLLMLCLISCASGSDGDELLTLTYRQVELSVGMDGDALLVSLGNDYTVSEAPSCAGQGVDRLYTYPSLRLYVFAPETGGAVLQSVSYTDDTVKTEQGLCIGSPAEDVMAVHGEPQEQGETALISRQGQSTLTFTLRDGRVTGITLSGE